MMMLTKWIAVPCTPLPQPLPHWFSHLFPSGWIFSHLFSSICATLVNFLTKTDTFMKQFKKSLSSQDIVRVSFFNCPVNGTVICFVAHYGQCPELKTKLSLLCSKQVLLGWGLYSDWSWSMCRAIAIRSASALYRALPLGQGVQVLTSLISDDRVSLGRGLQIPAKFCLPLETF